MINKKIALKSIYTNLQAIFRFIQIDVQNLVTKFYFNNLKNVKKQCFSQTQTMKDVVF